MMHAGSVMERTPHTSTIIRRARSRRRTSELTSKPIPRRCPKRLEAWKRGQSAGGPLGGRSPEGDRRIQQIQEVAVSLLRGMEAPKALQNERSALWPGNSQQDEAAVDQT